MTLPLHTLAMSHFKIMQFANIYLVTWHFVVPLSVLFYFGCGTVHFIAYCVLSGFGYYDSVDKSRPRLAVTLPVACWCTDGNAIRSASPIKWRRTLWDNDNERGLFYFERSCMDIRNPALNFKILASKTTKWPNGCRTVRSTLRDDIRYATTVKQLAWNATRLSSGKSLTILSNRAGAQNHRTAPCCLKLD